MDLPRVAFLGLGIMGSRMAGRLLRAGYPLTVFNRSRHKALPLVEAGAVLAETPAGAAGTADIIISMVADDAASRRIWIGRDGVLSGARTGSIFIECSNLSHNWVEELAEEAKRAECGMVDAPVLGSPAEAADGLLTFFVGAFPATLARVQVLLECLGHRVQYIGRPGNGTQIKLIHDFLCTVQVAALAESVLWMHRTAVNRERGLLALTRFEAGSPIVQSVARRMEQDPGPTHYPLKLALQHLDYGIENARQHDVDLTMGMQAFQRFKKASVSGHAEHDISAVVMPMW